MDRRIWILLAVVGVALVAWRLWPDRGSSSPAASGSRPDSAHEDTPPPTGPTAGKGRLAPPAPVRMQARSGGTPIGPRAGVSIVFEAEDRDESWASQREAEVRVRAGRVLADAVKLGAVECRSRSCRVSLASEDPSALALAIDRLGEESGFDGEADQMTVETTEPGEGGPRAVNVYLRYAR